MDYDIPRIESSSTSHIVTWRGDIESDELKESSGLTYSTRSKGVLWSINDSGSSAEIFALTEEGSHLGKWSLSGLKLSDWEGMDSFRLNNKHYLLIGDTGDNFRSKKSVSFIVVEEPIIGGGRTELDIAWKNTFSYPDGAKDVEAIAVDISKRLVLLLNKRELPLRLYSVPLLPSRLETEATMIAELVPIPRYNPRLESLYGKGARYLGLPTGMDLFDDSLLVTTYRHAYLYDYLDLAEAPKEVMLPSSGQREAITYGFRGSGEAFVSRERDNGTEVADIFQIKFNHE